jgi:hypothetical protein
LYDGEKGKKTKITIYEVVGIIDDNEKYENFVPKNGFIPVLHGEAAYNHNGLKTRVLDLLTETI